MEERKAMFDSIDSVSTVVVDQKMNKLEGCCKCLGCCCIDFANQYDWLVDEQIKFSAKEDSGNCSRFCCNPYHPLTLDVTRKGDKQKVVLSVKKPFRGCCFALCCCRKEISIEQNGVAIGRVQEPTCGGCLSPKLDLFNVSEGRSIGTLSGPLCCVGGSCGGTNFTVAEKSEDEKVIAKIKKAGAREVGLKRGLFTDADKYKLDFLSEKLTIDDKLILLSTVMFIDYLFFEGETTCLVNCCVCPPQCWCKICELYCCGCTCPIRIKCCTPDEEKD